MLRDSWHILLILAVALTLPQRSELHAAEAPCACQHCGCHRHCQQVCRLVKDEKKVTVVCFGSQCEDFCLPGKSCRGCLNSEVVCTPEDTKDGEEPCSHPKNFVWYDWTLGCAQGIHTKKKLMRKSIEKKIPNYKWVVEDLCAECEQKCLATQIEPGYVVPLPPETFARPKYGVRQVSGESDSSPQQRQAKAKSAISGSPLWPAWLRKAPGSTSQ